MGLAKLYSRALCGMQAPQVYVEVHVANGLPSFSIVGLPDTEVKESRDRVRSAIQMSGFAFPASRITVNLAPADLPKDSGRYDLPIALGVLLASGLIKSKIDINQLEFAGELALDGNLRKLNGALAIAYNAQQSARGFVLPSESATEAGLVDGLTIYPATSLMQVVRHLTCECAIDTMQEVTKYGNIAQDFSDLDFNQVKGQLGVKKALEIAASGRHSMLMVGNPGCGKSMLAQRISSIMPDLPLDKAIETASVYSLTHNGFDLADFAKTPFRQPHHSGSGVAIVGGGSIPKPGEISLAHNGVLFMDEVPEFERRVLELLREPLETKKINIARATQKVQFPADFQLIAAMNPCPCGNAGHSRNLCKCTPEQVSRYTAKLSAPLVDRIDLVVEVAALSLEELEEFPVGESSETIRRRVIKARNLQIERQGKLNYDLTNSEVEEHCILEVKSRDLLRQISDKFGVSARSYYRSLKVARTIADLDNSEVIKPTHIAQGAQFRKRI